MLYPHVFVAFNTMNTRQEGATLTAMHSAPPNASPTLGVVHTQPRKTTLVGAVAAATFEEADLTTRLLDATAALRLQLARPQADALPEALAV